MDDQELPIERPKLGIMLPRFTEQELAMLGEALCIEMANHREYCQWLLNMVFKEVHRRQTPGTEAEMEVTPIWGATEMGPVLLGSYIFLRIAFPDRVHEFLEAVDMHIVASSISLLNQIGAQQSA